MKTKSAILHFGSVAKLANALGVTRTAIYLWREEVPAGRAYQLELMTGGALQAVEVEGGDADKPSDEVSRV